MAPRCPAPPQATRPDIGPWLNVHLTVVKHPTPPVAGLLGATYRLVGSQGATATTTASIDP